MNRKEEIVNSIENIYNNQKERYNEQLQQLYELTNQYYELTGIHPISGRKRLELNKVSENTYSFIQQATQDGFAFPISIFEQTLLECIDKKNGSISLMENAKKFINLLNNTHSVGERYYLIEVLYRTKSRPILDFLYSNGLQRILYEYLNDNCDIVTNYDYILYVLNLLAIIPLPAHQQSQLFSLDSFIHCGDPDIEDIAIQVRGRWN